MTDIDEDLIKREAELQKTLDALAGREPSTPEEPTFVTSDAWPSAPPAETADAELQELLTALATDDGDGTAVTLIAAADLDKSVTAKDADAVLAEFTVPEPISLPANDDLLFEDE